MNLKRASLLTILVVLAFVAYKEFLIPQESADRVINSRNDQLVKQDDNKEENVIQGKKALIVYYSYTGHTRKLAEQIQTATGADIFELQPATPYSTDYNTVVNQGKKEVESGYQPPLKESVNNLASYNVVFVGTPIWWYSIAPPVATFLAESNLEGKTIIPFCTHGGYGAGHSLEDIKKLVPNGLVLDELILQGSDNGYAQGDILSWLSKNSFGE